MPVEFDLGYVHFTLTLKKDAPSRSNINDIIPLLGFAFKCAEEDRNSDGAYVSASIYKDFQNVLYDLLNK